MNEARGTTSVRPALPAGCGASFSSGLARPPRIPLGASAEPVRRAPSLLSIINYMKNPPLKWRV